MTTIATKTAAKAAQQAKALASSLFGNHKGLCRVGLAPQGWLIEATDLDTWLTVRAGAAEIKESALAPATNLIRLLKACGKSGEAEAAVEGDVLTLAAGPRRFKLPSPAVALTDWPAPPVWVKPRKETASVGNLRQGLESVIHAVSTDDCRQNLNTVCVELRDGVTRAVTTDGCRLAHAPLSVHGPAKPTLYRREGVTFLLRVLKGLPEDTPLNIVWSPGGLTCTWELEDGITYEVRARAYDGQFPAWVGVLPQDTPYRVVVDRAALVEEVHTLIVATGATRKDPTWCNFDIQGAAFDLTACGIDASSASTSVDVLKVERGPSPKQEEAPCINLLYLEDALKRFKGEAIELRWEKLGCPIWISAPHADTASTFELIMPREPGR